MNTDLQELIHFLTKPMKLTMNANKIVVEQNQSGATNK